MATRPAGRETGQNPRPWTRGGSRRVRAPVPARGPAPVRRGVLRLDRRLQPGRPLLGLVFIGELLGAGQLDWSWWQNLLAVLGAAAVVLAAIVVDQHRPGAAGSRDPEPAR